MSTASDGTDEQLSRARARALRELPAVDAVLRRVGERPGAAAAARDVLDELRRELLAGRHDGRGLDVETVAAQVVAALASWAEDAYPRVVNATGVVLHTGLGRAPLAAVAAQAVAAVCEGYTLLEVDAQTGDRRHREQRVVEDLVALTGAEAATVVNNNAAALLLALATLAEGKQVIVSRGELIEIGGGFRLPDLLARSGAQLLEVGTTNRTYTADYAEHLSWETGLVLRMHTSNYRVVGFQHTPPLSEVVEAAHVHGVPVLEDIGSGLLAPRPGGVLEDEPDAASALATGCDLVCFSGDKLLGGPQAGILVGRAELIARCRRHPLFRALRPDRMTLAALAATLRLHRQAPDDVPVLAALLRSPAERTARADALAQRLARRFPGASWQVVASEGSAGSGSAPARPVASAAVELAVPGGEAEAIARRLRTGTPSVFCRVWQGRLRFDVLALDPSDGQRLEQALAALPDVVGPASGS